MNLLYNNTVFKGVNFVEKKCKIEHLSKSYLINNTPQYIFRDFSMEFSCEKIVVFLGKSGCGKTTLLRMICALEDADEGDIIFQDEQGKFMEMRFGTVFQEPRLLPWRTVLENVLIHQQNPEKDFGMELIEKVKLNGFENSYPDEISGGMAARVAIARALAYRPNMLLMDEPFAALDYFTRQEMETDLIAFQQKEHIGVFFITHDLDETLLLAKEIIVLEKGKAGKKFVIDKPYPRNLADEDLVELKNTLMELLA